MDIVHDAFAGCVMGPPDPEMQRATLAGSPNCKTDFKKPEENTETTAAGQIGFFAPTSFAWIFLSGLACSFNLGSWPAMNAHVKPIADTSQQQRELVLAALRVCRRLELTALLPCAPFQKSCARLRPELTLGSRNEFLAALTQVPKSKNPYRKSKLRNAGGARSLCNCVLNLTILRK